MRFSLTSGTWIWTAPPRESACRRLTEPSGAGERHSLEVAEGGGGRLDRFVADALGLSRSRVQKLVTDGLVTVSGEVAKKSEVVAAGDLVEVTVPEAEPVDLVAEDIPLDVVFEDDVLLVINKQPGLVVHPAPGHRSGTLVNGLLHHYPDIEGVGGRRRPGLVHRLDRDTSGLMVVAKTDAAHRTLSDALRERRVKRRYLAAVWGHLGDDTVTVDAPLGRDAKDRTRQSVRDDGRRAVTHARVEERWLRADLLSVALETGRTHQIRVHMAHIGHPVVADPTYGVGWERGLGGPSRRWVTEMSRRAPRLFLHAAELAFEHPIGGDRVVFEAPLPPDLSSAADWARESSEI